MLGAFAISTFDNSDEDAKIDGRVRNYGFGIFSRLNFKFSTVFLDLSSFIILFSSIPFFISSFFIASASDISSPFPVPPEATTFISLCSFKYLVAVFIL